MKAFDLKLILFVVLSIPVLAAAQTTEFTYQGRLSEGGAVGNGNYDFEFRLYDALAAGGQIGPLIERTSVPVTNGAFAVQLDFGESFPGADRFLEIRVRTAGPGGYTLLTPRQKITSSPYSIKSVTAETASNALQLGGLAASTYLQTNGNGSGLTNLNGANITNNTINASALASDTFPNNQNLARLGQLRWDLLGQRVAVGTNPIGVAFDGTNIWVTNSGNANVTKLRASDGANLGTFGTGTNPRRIAFDGANVWVANSGSSTVTKLRASDGALQGTFAVGSVPIGIAFDGTNIWTANIGSGNVTKLRASDGANLGTFPVGLEPEGLAFDGANIWVTSGGSEDVTKLRASDGANLGTFPAGSGGSRAVAFDGANIWVVKGSAVIKLRSGDGANLGSFPIGTASRGIAFDGTNIWITSATGNNVTKLRASDGALQGTFAVGNAPQAVAFDGANMWVANENSNNVVKLPVFP